MAGLHLESPGIPAAVELDELKELYKTKKDLKYMTKHKRVATRHIDSRVQRQTHYMQRTLSYSGSPLEPRLHTHNRATSISNHTDTHTHTSIIAHQYKR